jgi:hypothetical protein
MSVIECAHTLDERSRTRSNRSLANSAANLAQLNLSTFKWTDLEYERRHSCPRFSDSDMLRIHFTQPFVSILFWFMQFISAGEGTAQDGSVPPFRGTIFEFPNLIKDSDATAFQDLRFIERAERTMFDRRVDKFASYPVFVFEAKYHDRRMLEVAVNREFESETAARKQAELYARALGRLPLLVRDQIDALHIQAGKRLFGGGRNLLIHVEQGEEYLKDGILEETLVHEAGHALDGTFAEHRDWLAAQQADRRFISSYAKENPLREDIAESILPYLAVRFRPERITEKQLQTIQDTIPARIAFFDSLKPDPFP